MSKLKQAFRIGPYLKVTLIGIFAVSISACSLTKPVIDQKEKEKPNIVFIVADDLGIYDLSYTGSKYYETPNIDRIALEGVEFTQGYAASRVCSPSRASILTGQFTARHGITDWIGAASGENWRAQGHNDKVIPSDYNHALSEKDLSLAEAFKQNGYNTFFAGKWHLGGEGNSPEDHGFEINKGGWEAGSPKGGYFSPWENPKLENKEPGENLSIRLGKETAQFIQDNREKPFFAMLSFYAVHGPIQTSEDHWKKYRDKAEKRGIAERGFKMERVLPIRVVQDNPVYAGLVSQMDDAVGIVLNKLKELGLESNTIVVFTSDNGGVASGDAYATSNLPLRGGKGYQWEGGIREPYFIKVPYLKNMPKKIDTPVSGVDFYPTLLDFAGLPIDTNQVIDGTSLRSIIEHRAFKERSLFWHYPHYGNQGGEPSSIIREGNFKLIHYWEDGRNELYDLKKDPGEQNEISSQESETVEKLYHKLDNFLVEVNAKRPKRDLQYDEAKAKALYKKRKTKLLPELESQRMRFLSRDYQPNATWWDSKIIKN